MCPVQELLAIGIIKRLPAQQHHIPYAVSNGQQKIKVVYSGAVDRLYINQSGLCMMLAHTATGFRPTSLAAKIAHIARAYLQGDIVIGIMSIGVLTTQSGAVFALMMLSALTTGAGSGPYIIGQLLFKHNIFLVPSCQVNLTDVIFGCVIGILLPFATGLDHMVITDSQSML
jgi:CDP-diglyceride synthetase